MQINGSHGKGKDINTFIKGKSILHIEQKIVWELLYKSL